MLITRGSRRLEDTKARGSMKTKEMAEVTSPQPGVKTAPE
jgi:hypothetical protein